MTYDQIAQILGEQAEHLLNFNNPKISKEKLYRPHPNSVEDVFLSSDRSQSVIYNLKKMFDFGRLGGTGYLNILPVDQDIEHTAGFTFAKNPDYFDPENIVKLALEGGVNALASSYGTLALVAKKYAEKLPLIVKLNHNQVLSYPNTHDQILFADARQAYEMGAVGVGATIYFGSEESKRQIQEISKQFMLAHELGLFTVLWCYPRNKAFRQNDCNYEAAADISAQAVRLGVTIGADLVKQKLPTCNHGFAQLNFGKYSDEMYNAFTSPHPIDLARFQVYNAYAGRIGLISSGGPSGGDDSKEAIMSAVINKRAGGVGLISGRKAFQKPLEQGVAILHAIQDVYLEERISIA